MTSSAILTLNAGSSSLKFSIWTAEADPHEVAAGQVEALGGDARLKFRAGAEKTERALGPADHAGAFRAIVEAMAQDLPATGIAAVGHRIVHGGTEFTESCVLTAGVLERLDALAPFAPLHQPHNLAAVRAAASAFPDAVQVGCFDTAFHRTHSWENDTYGLPPEFYDEGVRRYGFHGLSYEFIAGALRESDPSLASGRVIVAHLGNGASIAALSDGRSMASSMGFSTLDGLAMGTRPGQIDPGVLLYLMAHRGMSAEAISDLLYRGSGLKGMSGMTHDLRTLEASEEPAAARAIAYFVHRIRLEIGAMTAVLGGLDGLVFTGGIGENSALIRARVTEGMGWLGIALDPDANRGNAREIGGAGTRVLVIPTDEERVIARAAIRLGAGVAG